MQTDLTVYHTVHFSVHLWSERGSEPKSEQGKYTDPFFYPNSDQGKYTDPFFYPNSDQGKYTDPFFSYHLKLYNLLVS